MSAELLVHASYWRHDRNKNQMWSLLSKTYYFVEATNRNPKNNDRILESVLRGDSWSSRWGLHWVYSGEKAMQLFYVWSLKYRNEKGCGLEVKGKYALSESLPPSLPSSWCITATKCSPHNLALNKTSPGRGNWLPSEQRGWFAIGVPCGLTLIDKQTKLGAWHRSFPCFLSPRDDSDEPFILTVFPEKFPQRIKAPVSN